jgi:hypothetical protein
MAATGKTKESQSANVVARLEELELAVAQVAVGLRQCVGWKPEINQQQTLSRVIERAQSRHSERERAALEQRPATTELERRAA